MTHFPNDNDEQKLIAFLQQHRPFPPSLKDGFEMELMEKINHLPQENTRSAPRRLLWIVPSVILASLCLLWGGMRLFYSNPEFAQQTMDEELEAFLLDGWYGTMGETSYGNAQANFEQEWSFTQEQLSVNSQK